MHSHPAARSTQHAHALALLLAGGALALLTALPQARADFEDYCDAAAVQGLDYAVAGSPTLITGSCDAPGAELYVFCDMRGTGSRCASVSACSLSLLGQATTRVGCGGDSTDSACCFENMHKPCATCAPVTSSCTEVCFSSVSGTPDSFPGIAAPVVTGDPLPPPSSPPLITSAPDPSPDPPPAVEPDLPALPSDEDDTEIVVVGGAATPEEPDEPDPVPEQPAMVGTLAPDYDEGDVDADEESGRDLADGGEWVPTGNPLADAVASSAPALLRLALAGWGHALAALTAVLCALP